MSGPRQQTPPLRPDPAYEKAFAQIMARIGRTLGAGRPARPVVVCVAGVDDDFELLGHGVSLLSGERVRK